MPSVDRIIRVMTIKWVASTRSVVTSPLIQHFCNGKHPTNSKKKAIRLWEMKGPGMDVAKGFMEISGLQFWISDLRSRS